MSKEHSRIEAKVLRLKFLALLREAKAGNIEAILALDQVYGPPLQGGLYPEGLEVIIDAYLSNIEADAGPDSKLN